MSDLNIVSNCPLCGNHTLSIIGDVQKSNEVNQCMFCGYTTSNKYRGTKDDCEYYKLLPEDYKKVAIEKNNYVWIPTIMTLPMGILKHVIVEDEIMWAYSPVIDETAEEPEYENKAVRLFNKFHAAIEELNKLFVKKEKEANQPKEKTIKLPKLKKIDA